MNISDILKGHFNEFTKREQELSEERMVICKACPLYKITAVGPVCNKNLFLNKITNEVTDQPEYGFKSGCGCRLDAKSRIPDAHCPLDKW